MIRTVSTKEMRVYFTDIDFLMYDYQEKEKIRRYLCIIEAKRRYQIKEGIYKLVDSDKTAISVAKTLGVPFLFIFYDQGKLNDDDDVLVIIMPEVADIIYLEEKREKKQAASSKVSKLKAFLRCLKSNSIQDCWRILEF